MIFLVIPLCLISALDVVQTNSDADKSPLYGKHLVVTGLETTIEFSPIRNATGYIVGLQSGAYEALEYLSARYKITYSVFQIAPNPPLDSSGGRKGTVNYVASGECDVVISVAPTAPRVALIDFSHATLYIPISFLIPKSSTTANILAVSQPFSFWAWIAIVLSIPVVVLTTHFFMWHQQKGIKDPSVKKHGKSGHYVVGLLLKQAGYCLMSRKTTILLIAGAWGLAVFILHNYYTTLLISYVTSPTRLPLIKSIYDLRKRPELALVTNQNINIDAMLTSAESGFFKELGDKLRAKPNSRCVTTQDCVDMVKAGRTVYTSGRDSYLFQALRDDFKATGQCNLELAKENYVEVRLSWGLAKKNPYMDSINISIMKLHEAGLLRHWYKESLSDPSRCLHVPKPNEELKEITPLTLEGLTGAFVVLVLGFFISLMILIGEKSTKHS